MKRDFNKYFSFLVCILLAMWQHSPYSSLGQTNLIPNSGFQNGANAPQCRGHYSHVPQHGNSCNLWDFDEDINDWKIANPHPFCQCGALGGCVSPDWIDINTCIGGNEPCSPYDPNIFTSTRFVHLLAAGDEGVRVGLTQNLQGGRTYIFRMRLMPATFNSDNQLLVLLTKFGEHWNSSPVTTSNVKYEVDNYSLSTINNAFDFCGIWYLRESTFTVPNNLDGELRNLVLQAVDGSLLVDDVELFLSPTATDCCPDFKLYEATQNLPTTTHVEDFIRAGNDVGIPNVSGNVIVQSGQNVTFKAGNFIELLPGFETELGATFTAEIEECNNATNSSGDAITIVQFPNTFGGIGELSELWVSANNATQYHATIFNRWGNRIFEVTGDILSDPFWIWHGTGACGPDDYFVILELFNCDNSFSQGQTVRYNGGSMCKTGNTDTGSAEDSVETLDTLSIPEPLTLTSAQTLQSGFNIYPNPYQGSTSLPVKSDKLFVDITGTEAAQVLIVVVDMLGIERYSKVFVLPALNGTKAKDAQYTLAIDPEGKLPAGVYMVIAASDNELYRKKIVIQ